MTTNLNFAEIRQERDKLLSDRSFLLDRLVYEYFNNRPLIDDNDYYDGVKNGRRQLAHELLKRFFHTNEEIKVYNEKYINKVQE